jgi:hypothetical protein
MSKASTMANTDQRAEWKKYRATQLAWALERGRCTRCKKVRATDGRRTCESCRIRFRVEMKERKAAARADGMCLRCEQVRVTDTVRCTSCAAACYKYDRARRERARQDGQCGKCFMRPAADGLLSCRICIDTTAANNKARKLARKETTK